MTSSPGPFSVVAHTQAHVHKAAGKRTYCVHAALSAHEQHTWCDTRCHCPPPSCPCRCPPGCLVGTAGARQHRGWLCRASGRGPGCAPAGLRRGRFSWRRLKAPAQEWPRAEREHPGGCAAQVGACAIPGCGGDVMHRDDSQQKDSLSAYGLLSAYGPLSAWPASPAQQQGQQQRTAWGCKGEAEPCTCATSSTKCLAQPCRCLAGSCALLPVTVASVVYSCVGGHCTYYCCRAMQDSSGECGGLHCACCQRLRGRAPGQSTQQGPGVCVHHLSKTDMLRCRGCCTVYARDCVHTHTSTQGCAACACPT